VFTCSRNYALQAAGPKVIIPVISGLYTESALPKDQRAQYSTWAGQVAPSPGFIEMQAQVDWWANDSLMWHRSGYLNWATYPLAIDQGDTYQIGGFGSNSGSRIVVANCSGFGSFDECFQLYGTNTDITLWQCMISNPFSDSNHPNGDHHSTALIIGPNSDRVSVLRTIMQHGTHRLPLVQSQRFSMANCLAYNAGKSSTNSLSWNDWTRVEQAQIDISTATANSTNLVENLYVAGPDSLAGYKPIQLGQSSPAFATGSQVYIRGNRVRNSGGAFINGDSSTNQADIYSVNASVPSGFIASNKITSAWPSGYNELVLTDDAAGKRAFAALMELTAGFRPKDRAAGWDVFSASHAKNYIDGLTGITNIGKVVDAFGSNGPSLYGTYPFTGISSSTIDVFDSVAMGGDPMLTVEGGRDAIQASGLTAMEEWLQRWHFRRAYY
jgi:hypothetical protein